jgi:CheY-like chemotaxis protein
MEVSINVRLPQTAIRRMDNRYSTLHDPARLNFPPSLPQGATPFHPLLLYVEDNPENMELVRELIARREDVDFLSAVDAHSGLALTRTHQPQVILMDVNLPGLNGMDALRMLRADPSSADIPVIALSSDAFPRQIEKGLEAGFFRYLTKPFKINELMAAIDDALDMVTDRSAA